MFRRDPAAQFTKQVKSRGHFTKDWFTRHIGYWEPHMSALEGQRALILELGSFEGLSTAYMLWRLRDARVTAVDTFTSEFGDPELERRFDHNVGLVDGNRVQKIVAPSREVLPRLIAEGKRYHFIYVDASHEPLDVVVDAALAWRLLRPGAVIVFDDYGQDTEPKDRPTEATDAFARLVVGSAEPVLWGWQAAFRRIG